MTNPSEILNDLFQERIEKNPRFSLRSFARTLSLSPAYLSLVLSGKRKLSLKRATLISDKLELSDGQRHAFVRSVALSTLRSEVREVLGTHLDPESPDPYASYFSIDRDRSLLLSRWYHVAILDLISCKDFEPDVNWISQRLDVPGSAIQDAVDRLHRLGLIEITEKNTEKRWRKTNRDLFVATRKSESDVREFHKQMAELAIKTLETKTSDSDFDLRSISGMTMAINTRNLPKAKKMIAKFQNDLADLLTRGDCTNVHQLSVHLFPLTHNGSAV